MNNVKLASKFLYRDWRSGELSLLVIALIIAVASTTTISLFGDRLQRTMEVRASEFLGADLVLSSHSDMPIAWLERAKTLGLQVARTAEFSSVVLNGEELLLSGIKACTSGYPLRGDLKTTTGDLLKEVVTKSIPTPGNAWVDARVINRLGLAIGDELEVGEKPLQISRIITHEPDRKGNFLSLAPRIMINYEDLAATNVIQPGSHIHYYLLFAGVQKSLAEFGAWVRPQLNPSQRILDVNQERPDVGNTLSRAEQYLGLASIIVVLIAGVAIAMATQRYTQRHFNVTAMLRCLGLIQKDIVQLYLIQILIIGVIASFIGYLIGWSVQELMLYVLRDLLPIDLVSPSWYALLLGVASGLIILGGFALPPLLRLRRVSALKIFRRDLMPLPPSVFVVYGFAISSLVILLWRYTNNFKMTAYIVLIGFGSLLVLAFIMFAVLMLCRYLSQHSKLGLRFGLLNLSRSPKTTIGQILAFCITLTAMILIVLVRTDLIESWQTQIPDQAPNNFALNIFPNEVNEIKRQFEQEGIKHTVLYPIVRGRLVEINDIGLDEVAEPGSYGERATNRDLSMTYTDDVPIHNRIEKGKWRDNRIIEQVSVEERLAESLGIDVGDQLTFSIGSERFTVPVTSIRSVQWDAMKPTFYMMFSPQSLTAYPRTFLTSFYVPADNKLAINRLIKRFPSVTILEIDMIIAQFKRIIKQVTIAIEFILVFALLAGFAVLFAAVRATIDNRIFEGALLRTLGANRALLRTSRVVEFCGMGFFAGLLSAITAELIAWWLYSQAFNFQYAMSLWIWIVTPLVGALIIGFAGYLGTRIVLQRGPVTVLRQL